MVVPLGKRDVDRKEFEAAMAAIGIEARGAELDELFKRFDPDGSGKIDYRELHALLRQAAPPPKLDLGALAPPEPSPRSSRLRPATAPNGGKRGFAAGSAGEELGKKVEYNGGTASQEDLLMSSAAGYVKKLQETEARRATKREAERREAAARRREGVDAAAPEEVRLRPKKLTPWLPAGRARDFDEM